MRFIKPLLLGLAGWFIFSLFALLPQKLSAPIPKGIQSYKSNLYNTGYTYRNEFKRLYDEAVVESQTFSDMGLFQSNNLVFGGYFNAETNSIYLNTGEIGGSYSLDGKEWTAIIDEAATPIVLDACEIALTQNKAPRLHRKGNFYKNEYWNRPYDWSKDTDRCDSEIIKLLERSESEQITIGELMSLLQYTYVERLAGWFPTEQIAIFKHLTKDDQVVYYRYHTAQQENSVYPYERYGPFDYDAAVVISSHCLLTYNADTSSIEVLDFLTGETETKITGIDSVESLQFCYNEQGELIIGGILADNRGFVKCGANDDLAINRFPENSSRRKFFLTEDKVLVFWEENDDYYSLTMTYDEWKGLGKQQ